MADSRWQIADSRGRVGRTHASPFPYFPSFPSPQSLFPTPHSPPNLTNPPPNDRITHAVAHSSRGPGCSPIKAETRVRVPYGPPQQKALRMFSEGFFLRCDHNELSRGCAAGRRYGRHRQDGERPQTPSPLCADGKRTRNWWSVTMKSGSRPACSRTRRIMRGMPDPSVLT